MVFVSRPERLLGSAGGWHWRRVIVDSPDKEEDGWDCWEPSPQLSPVETRSLSKHSSLGTISARMSSPLSTLPPPGSPTCGIGTWLVQDRSWGSSHGTCPWLMKSMMEVLKERQLWHLILLLVLVTLVPSTKPAFPPHCGHTTVSFSLSFDTVSHNPFAL